MGERTYSDEALATAVADSHSWRGVLRALGLRATSAGSARTVRRRADELGLTHAHFTGQRRWSDTQLTQAIGSSATWTEAAGRLSLAASGSTVSALRAHAVRLALDTGHLDTAPPRPAAAVVPGRVHPDNIRSAGAMFAAAWFALRGVAVSWPLEPCRYDLAVDLDGRLRRVQVKTTVAIGASALVMVSSTRRRGRALYAPGEIDYYFLIDGALDAYLIPYELVAGYGQVQLGRYVHFKVVERGAMLSEVSSPGP